MELVHKLFGSIKRDGVKVAASKVFRNLIYTHYIKVELYYRIKIRTPLIAATASLRIKASRNKGLFLDLGSNVGQGFEFFRQRFSSKYFDYELFEPNPNCLPYLYKIKEALPDHRILIHNEAVGLEDGFMTFYGLSESEGGKLSQGGSILKEHNSSWYESKQATTIRVPSINFSDLLLEKSKHYNLIVIKMDIESAEYDVLEDLLKKGLFSNIYAIFCEFHSQYMAPEQRAVYQQKEERIKSEIKKTPCSFVLWV